MEMLITGMIVVSSVLIPVAIGYLLAGITATVIWRYKKYIDMKYWREKAIFVFEQSKPETVKAIAIALIRATELTEDTQQFILGGGLHDKSGE